MTMEDIQASPYAKPGQYITQLTPDDETKFQSWVKANKIPWHEDPKSDYDMRGFYKSMQVGQASRSNTNLHFPDTFKTPYHQSFSNESKYATPDAPHWVGNSLIDKNGKTVFSEPIQQEDMRGISFQSIPFKFDVSKARTDGYSDDEILKHLGESKQFDTQRALKDGYSKQELINHLTGFSPELDPSHGRDTTDHVINFLRPLLSSAAATVAAPTSALTGGVPVGPVAAYTGMDALLQHLQSKPPEGIVSQGTGMEPGGIASTLSNTAEQYGTGKLLDGLIGGVGRGIKAVRNADQLEIYNFEPTTSQAAKSYGYSKLAGISKAMEDVNKTAKNAALDRTAGRGFSEALETARNADLNYSRNPNTMLELINDDFKIGQAGRSQPTYNSLKSLDDVISDPAKLKATLVRAQELGTGDNLKKSLGGYKFMDIFNKATTRDVSKNATFIGGNATRIDPEVLSKEWLDPEVQESLKTLYNSKQRADIKQFFTNITNTQDKISLGAGRRFMLVPGGITIAHALLGGNLIHTATVGAAATGAYIGTQGLAKLLTDPKTARFMVALAGSEPLGVSEQYAARAIAQVLNGSVVSMINPSGERTPGKIEDGKFIPLEK